MIIILWQILLPQRQKESETTTNETKNL
jgi:hypothetical protein